MRTQESRNIFQHHDRHWWAYRLERGDFDGFQKWEHFLGRFIGHPEQNLEPLLQAALRTRDDAMRVAADLWSAAKTENIALYVATLPNRLNSDRWHMVFGFRSASAEQSIDNATYYISTQSLPWLG